VPAPPTAPQEAPRPSQALRVPTARAGAVVAAGRVQRVQVKVAATGKMGARAALAVMVP